MKEKKVIIFGPWCGEFSYELSWWNPEIRKVRNDDFKNWHAVHVGFKGRRAMYKDFIDEYIIRGIIEEFDKNNKPPHLQSLISTYLDKRTEEQKIFLSNISI